MKRAITFPGQGSQYVGMGKSLYDTFPVAKAVFQEIDDALGANLSKIMFEGPEDDLKLTHNTQPALMAHSLAVIRILTDGGVGLSDIADYAAGHSLGEYSALAATGAIELSDTAKLLRLRGEAMQRAVPIGSGAMAALIGIGYDTVKAVCEEASEGEVCDLANDNAYGQLVVSGHKGAVERAIVIAKKSGAKMGILLPVSAPFHCSLMGPAAIEMREALISVAIVEPIIPIIANVKASEVTDPVEIKSLLVEQVTGFVRWRESVNKMVELGCGNLLEIGAGKVLSGLVRRIDRSILTLNIQDPKDIEYFTNSI
ncbi:MAG: ACP S-malonyltransferase [Sphingomonadales bacterium]